MGGALSGAFSTTFGVRKGCMLAPALFSRAMDWILERVASRAGISLPECGLSDPVYADDVALLGESAAQLAAFVDCFEEEASILGLNISWQKTKVQNLGSGTSLIGSIVVGGHQVEDVTQFTYLGSIQSSDARCMTDIMHGIDQL